MSEELMTRGPCPDCGTKDVPGAEPHYMGGVSCLVRQLAQAKAAPVDQGMAKSIACRLYKDGWLDQEHQKANGLLALLNAIQEAAQATTAGEGGQ